MDSGVEEASDVFSEKHNNTSLKHRLQFNGFFATATLVATWLPVMTSSISKSITLPLSDVAIMTGHINGKIAKIEQHSSLSDLVQNGPQQTSILIHNMLLH